MLMEVRKHLRLMAYYFKFNLSSAMEYRASFLLQFFGMILNNSAFIFFWWILFNNVGSIGGYGFKDEMLLWCLSSTSFGICHVMFGNVGYVTKMVINGELDPYLLQPKDPVINMLCSKTVVSSWGDMLYGIIMFFIIRGLDIKGFLLFLLFSITGGLMFTAVTFTFSCLTFYIGNAQGIVDMVQEFLISFGIYPEGIFPDGLKYVLYTVIPVGFMIYMPAGAINSFSWSVLAKVILAAAAWVGIAYVAFYRGLKKYESGNLIGGKL
jgi:ABC-2 type transport system permease protein